MGRQDERSQADANTLTLTLDNRDGRFTAGKTSGAYYPNVKLGRPIRVTADPVDGAVKTRFLGFIDEWPTEWDDTDAYARATITATSRLSRLGAQSELRSIVEETILADSPAAYYTLGEPEGATQANDSSGNGATPLLLAGDASLPLVFGNATGPGTDGLTAAQFAGGQYLSGGAYAPTGSSQSFEVAFLIPAAPGAEEALFSLQSGATSGIALTADFLGRLIVRDGTGSTLVGPTATAYADNATHWATLIITGGTLTLHIDGSLVLSVATSALSTSLVYDIRLGNYPEFDAAVLRGAHWFRGRPDLGPF